METKAHYALIGAFVLALMAAAAIFVVWLSQVSFREEFDEYHVVFRGPVRGLSTASDVRFNGVKVGEVIDVDFDEYDESNVLAQIRISAATPVKSDSLARLEPQGITGLSYIQITAGDPDSPEPLRWGDQELPRIESEQASLDVLFEGGEDVVQNANEVLIRLNALLSEENVGHLSETVESVRRVTGQLEENGELIADARSAIANLNEAAASIQSAAEQFEAFTVGGSAMIENQMIPALVETDLAAQRVNVAAQDASAMLQAMQPALNRFAASGLDEISLAASDMRRLIAVLERIARELERDPSAFLSGVSREEVEIQQ